MELSTEPNKSKRTYFRQTTASQRRLLFEEAALSGNICEAARRAHTSRGTYYYWLERYETSGVAGLSEERSRAPHHTRIPSISPEIKDAVLAYHKLHPAEGCRTVASRIRQAYGKKVISHTKVWEIIREAKASQSPPEVKTERKSRNPIAGMPAVHAPEPDQTINIDLCVVPFTHSINMELPMFTLIEAAASKPAAASGDEPSVKESVVAATPAPASCPGQVFTCEEASYEEQMAAYMIHREEKRSSKSTRKDRRRKKQAEKAELNARILEIRVKNRQQRKARQAEDDAWKGKKKSRRAAKAELKRLSRQERRTQKDACQSQEAQWQDDKAAHQQQMQQRAVEDKAVREERRQIISNKAALFPALSLATAWIAILVVVDNCTRKCIGIPLFTAGAHVTAEMIISALFPMCPAGLRYLISDNGPQFIAEICSKQSKISDVCMYAYTPAVLAPTGLRNVLCAH